jgi:hypothetical protein
MNKFIKWLKGFGFKLAIDMIKGKTDWLAKKMADSVDIPFVSEANEKKEAKKAIDAIVALLEELAENELKPKK